MMSQEVPTKDDLFTEVDEEHELLDSEIERAKKRKQELKEMERLLSQAMNVGDFNITKSDISVDRLSGNHTKVSATLMYERHPPEEATEILDSDLWNKVAKMSKKGSHWRIYVRGKTKGR